MIRKQDIPNALTFSRYAALPILVAAWYLPTTLGLWAPFSIVLLAALTDFLDGFLARRWNAQSDLGRLLDPNADKLLVAVGLLLLVAEGLAPVVPVALIVCRELFVSGLREFATERGLTLHVTALAKWKTTTQLLALLLLLLAYAIQDMWWVYAGQALLWIAALLTLLTGLSYWKAVRRYISSPK